MVKLGKYEITESLDAHNDWPALFIEDDKGGFCNRNYWDAKAKATHGLREDDDMPSKERVLEYPKMKEIELKRAWKAKITKVRANRRLMDYLN